MKKIYLITVMVLSSTISQEQASIVYDPTNGAQIASVLSTIKELRDLNEEWRASAEFMQNVINQGNEVKRLITLLDGIVCATDDLEMFLALSVNEDICERKIKLDMVLGKIDGVSSSLKTLLTGGLVLSQYETITSLKTLNDELEEAANQVLNLNSILESEYAETIRLQNMERNGADRSYVIPELNI